MRPVSRCDAGFAVGTWVARSGAWSSAVLFLQWIPRNTGDDISNKIALTSWIGQIGWPKRRIDLLRLYSVGRSKRQLLLVKIRPTMLFSQVVVLPPLVLSGRHRRQRLR